MPARRSARRRISEQARIRRDSERLLRESTEGVGLPGAAARPKASKDDGGLSWGGVGDFFKDVGEGALDVLSVPGAVVETGITNALAGAGIGRSQSWKDMLGGFSSTYRPGEGYASVAEDVGLDPKYAKWAGLGASFVLDPTWLVGGKVVTGAVGAAAMADRAAAGARLVKGVRGAASLPDKRVAYLLDNVAEGVDAQRRARQGVAGIRLGTKKRGVDVPLGIKVNPKPIDRVGVPGAPQHLRELGGGVFRTNPLYDVYHRLQEASAGVYFDRLRGTTGRLAKMDPDDVRKLARDQADDAFLRYVDRQLPGLGKAGGKAILHELTSAGAPRGALGNSRLASRYRDTVSVMKTLYTIPRPAHFLRNAVGSLFNHLGVATGRTAVRPMTKESWRLSHQVKGEGVLPIMGQKFNVDGVDLTGAELMVVQRMMGMGTGGLLTRARIVGGPRQEADDLASELAQGATILDNFFRHGAGSPVRRAAGSYYRFMRDLNITRDDAQRIHDWWGFVKSGNDPFEAASKVIRSQFDYAAATDFERRVLRQFVMFYTWSRKNIPYQASLLATRPGYMSTLDKATWPDENMPEHAADRFGLRTPVGRFNIGLPIQDLGKFQLDTRNARANIGTSLNPLVRYPLERGTGIDFFSGKPLGDVRPREDTWSRVAQLLNIPGAAKVVPYKGEKPVNNWTSADVDHFVRTLLGGPLPSDVGRLNDSDYSTLDAALSNLGISPMGGARDQRKWKQSLKAQAEARKREKKGKSYRRPVE